MDRRTFLNQSGGAALALGALGSSARAADDDSSAGKEIRLGLVGCGGRGSWIAKLFEGSGRYVLASVVDYFPEKAGAVGEAHGVAAERRFSGLQGYARMLDAGGLDAVAIISPPYFHPEQAAAAVEAGVAIYLAKPVAVDVPGTRSIERSAGEAAGKGLPFLVDFQTRNDPFFVEAMRRVHEGALGEMCFGESAYHAGRLQIQRAPGTPEARLSNWVFDRALSGDIITEQNIHTLDVMSWAMGVAPVRATGTGGRKVRTDVGDCWDHFALTFEYPDGVGIAFTSRQFEAHGAPGGIRNRMFGSRGVLETEYGGRVLIRGNEGTFYQGGETGAIYQEGTVRNITAFADAIAAGDTSNPTVAPSVQSNFVTILGRSAAYQGNTVSWDEMMASDTPIEADLTGLKA
ncbi:Gfo/Idh/MocA family oxidoreductase [soil metagenome]